MCCEICSEGCFGKIRTRGALFSVKSSAVLNANNPWHLNRVKLDCSGFSHLQYVLQRLLQAYFQFQAISFSYKHTITKHSKLRRLQQGWRVVLKSIRL